MGGLIRFLVVTTVLTLAGHCLYGQAVQNVRATFQDGKVHITYDLTGGNPNQKYAFDLYSSHNDYISPLRRVTGDIGKNVSPGIGKFVDWDATAELGQFKGDLTFKVRGEPMPLSLSFRNPVSGGSVRRGKSTSVDWEGGRKDQNIKLELLDADLAAQTLTQSTNTGSYSWKLPANMKTGKYTLKLTSGSETVESGAFSVKSKIPLLLKVLPLAIIGGVIASQGGGTGPVPPGPETVTDLPTPREPGG